VGFATNCVVKASFVLRQVEYLGHVDMKDILVQGKLQIMTIGFEKVTLPSVNSAQCKMGRVRTVKVVQMSMVILENDGTWLLTSFVVGISRILAFVP